jgi:hypothetical protein
MFVKRKTTLSFNWFAFLKVAAPSTKLTAAAMATPPWQWSVQFQSMFRQLSWQSHWPKVERDRVFWSFVQRSERGR